MNMGEREQVDHIGRRELAYEQQNQLAYPFERERVRELRCRTAGSSILEKNTYMNLGREQLALPG